MYIILIYFVMSFQIDDDVCSAKGVSGTSSSNDLSDGLQHAVPNLERSTEAHGDFPEKQGMISWRYGKVSENHGICVEYMELYGYTDIRIYDLQSQSVKFWVCVKIGYLRFVSTDG